MGTEYSVFKEGKLKLGIGVTFSKVRELLDAVQQVSPGRCPFSGEISVWTVRASSVVYLEDLGAGEIWYSYSDEGKTLRLQPVAEEFLQHLEFLVDEPWEEVVIFNSDHNDEPYVTTKRRGGRFLFQQQAVASTAGRRKPGFAIKPVWRPTKTNHGESFDSPTLFNSGMVP